MLQQHTAMPSSFATLSRSDAYLSHLCARLKEMAATRFLLLVLLICAVGLSAARLTEQDTTGLLASQGESRNSSLRSLCYFDPAAEFQQGHRFGSACPY